MAGQPKRDAAIKALYQLAYDELGPEAMPLDWVVQEIAAAKTMAQIATRIAEHTPDHWMPSRGWLSPMLKSLTADAAQRIEQARVESAEALVERAAETLEDAGTDSREALQKAKALADIDLWLAARRDRAKFGDTPQVQIGISAGSLHLDALRAVQPRTLTLATTPALPPSSPQDGGTGDEAVETQGSAA